MTFKRRDIRLPKNHYIGRHFYFVTFCCEARAEVFKAPSRAQWLIGILKEETATHNFALHAYCVMPDHVHVLVEGLLDDSDLWRFAKSLKQKTAYSFRREVHQRLWQKKFYDHILRPRDSVEGVTWYIWMNPVRKGLCAAPQEYPFSGSNTVDWKTKCEVAQIWSPEWKKEVPA